MELIANNGFSICVQKLINEVEVTSSGIYIGDEKKDYVAYEVISSDVFEKGTIVMLDSFTIHDIKCVKYYISKTNDIVGEIKL